MGIFDRFKKRAPEAVAPVQPVAIEASPDIDYTPLIEMAEIISNGDAAAVADISLLVTDPDAFSVRHRSWLNDFGYEDHVAFSDVEVRDSFAYRLAGYETPFGFGAYIDWKEAPEEITAQLDVVLKNLGYPVDTSSLNLENEHTWEALVLIARHLEESDLKLAILDTESDCYHLYVVPTASFFRLVTLAASLDIRVHSAD